MIGYRVSSLSKGSQATCPIGMGLIETSISQYDRSNDPNQTDSSIKSSCLLTVQFDGLQQGGHIILSIFLWSIRLSPAVVTDSFTVPLHGPNGRPAVRAVQRDCHWGLKNSGNSHWSCKPIMQWGTRQSQSIFGPTNHKRVMPANWRPCFLPHWQSYCHQVRTV